MSTNDQATRPSSAREAALWDIAAQVPDPEIPVISIADLGILRDAFFEGETAVIIITPTYSGCPAMGHITDDIELALSKAGYQDFRIDTVLQPAWTTDWITETGRENLRQFGIAPPQGKAQRSTGPVLLTLGKKPNILCPHCGSENTKEITAFGSTSCKALYSCNSCFEPFDYFKVH